MDKIQLLMYIVLQVTHGIDSVMSDYLDIQFGFILMIQNLKILNYIYIFMVVLILNEILKLIANYIELM